MSDEMKTQTGSNGFETIKSYFKDFSKGLFSKNPLFILLCGLCPALAVSTSIVNSLAMGISVMSVLLLSNTIISIFRNLIPDKIKIFIHIVIISSLITATDLLIQKFFPDISRSLDLYLPLLSLSCLILGRAEIFAERNTFGRSILDASGMGLGFLMAILLIGCLREFVGNLDFNFKDIGFTDSLFGNEGRISFNISGKNMEILSGIKFFLQPAGAFIILGLITALIYGIRSSVKKDKS